MKNIIKYIHHQPTAVVVVLLLLLNVTAISAQTIKSIKATRIETAPQIDGLLGDKIWTTAKPILDFVEFFPEPNTPAGEQTEVRLLYDDKAIYISAILYTENIAAISKELSVRDDQNVQADMFEVYIDPYGKGQNALGFIVSASGIQTDYSVTPENEDLIISGTNNVKINITSLDRFMSSGRTDERVYEGVRGDVKGDPLTQSNGVAWDAVWESETKTYRNAWTVEMKIPYSALRFPDKDVQTWRINFKRLTNLTNEISFWNPLNPEQEGLVTQFGRVTGLRDIKPPPRLAFVPYAVTRSTYLPNEDRDISPWTHQLSGGMDLRLGINETTTLDVSLIPDFGQVVFDDVILNLGPFEQRFDENRPFFTEGFELFDRGGIFYSRRIGEAPINYQILEDDANEEPFDREILSPSQVLVSNPAKAQLINATKLTTRNRKGLGFGFLNALTSASIAEAQEGVNGAIIREIPTGPMTNYNIMVIDQLLPNNSHVSFTNTNVMRMGSDRDTLISGLTNGGYRDANVTALEYAIFDKNNSFGIIGKGSISQVFDRDATDDIRAKNGYAYSVKAGKFGGNFRYSLERDLESRNYDANDLGFSTQNRVFHKAKVEYKLFDSYGPFINFNTFAGIHHEQRVSPLKFANYYLDGGLWWTFPNNLDMGVFANIFPSQSNDFFEPRQDGLQFNVPKNFEINSYIATDFGQPFSYQLDFAYRIYPEWDAQSLRYGGLTRLRLGKGFNIQLEGKYETRSRDRGYVATNEGAVIIGQRNRRDITTAFTTNLIFSKKMSITARARHFWALVEYSNFSQLLTDGTTGPTFYNQDNDMSFNLYNIDLIYRFRIAPGSEFNIIWKRSLTNADTEITRNFFTNWNVMSNDIQPDNLLSLKLLYYIDYLDIQKKRR